MSKISLAIVDDEALIVSLLSGFFHSQKEIEVCYTGESGEALVEMLYKHEVTPDVLLLDLKMKGESGVEVPEFLKVNFPTIKTIIMSSYYKKAFMGFILKTGAAAFIPKGVSSTELLNIIKEVSQKGFFFSPDQLEVIRDQVSSRSPQPNLKEEADLSERELEVLKLICCQKTAKEIGEQLFITQRTVEGHKNNLFLKTETKNIAGLVIYAIRNGVVKMDEVML
ncbi:MAG: response regulator transcription factor [Flavobacteriales bacterium]|nr:response regulator transcription factor [Flavobacteriales bacterium]